MSAAWPGQVIRCRTSIVHRATSGRRPWQAVATVTVTPSCARIVATRSGTTRCCRALRACAVSRAIAVAVLFSLAAFVLAARLTRRVFDAAIPALVVQHLALSQRTLQLRSPFRLAAPAPNCCLDFAGSIHGPIANRLFRAVPATIPSTARVFATVRHVAATCPGVAVLQPVRLATATTLTVPPIALAAAMLLIGISPPVCLLCTAATGLDVALSWRRFSACAVLNPVAVAHPRATLPAWRRKRALYAAALALCISCRWRPPARSVRARLLAAPSITRLLALRVLIATPRAAGLRCSGARRIDRRGRLAFVHRDVNGPRQRVQGLDLQRNCLHVGQLDAENGPPRRRLRHGIAHAAGSEVDAGARDGQRLEAHADGRAEGVVGKIPSFLHSSKSLSACPGERIRLQGAQNNRENPCTRPEKLSRV